MATLEVAIGLQQNGAAHLEPSPTADPVREATPQKLLESETITSTQTQTHTKEFCVVSNKQCCTCILVSVLLVVILVLSYVVLQWSLGV